MAQMTVAHQPGGIRARLFAGRALLYVIILTLCVLFGFPLFWTLMSSLKTPIEMASFPPPWVPAVPQWSNYLNVLSIPERPVLLWTFNSAILAILVTSGSVITASLVAYSLARFEYRGRELLFVITLATLMLPAQVTLIPQFVLFFNLGWVNTLLPLWVPAWFGGGGFEISSFTAKTDVLFAEARRRGHSQVRLYTHVLMVENVAIYGRLGFLETHRVTEKGYDRVYMTKRLA